MMKDKRKEKGWSNGRLPHFSQGEERRKRKKKKERKERWRPFGQ
jgi:hypothetical protein